MRDNSTLDFEYWAYLKYILENELGFVKLKQIMTEWNKNVHTK